MRNSISILLIMVVQSVIASPADKCKSYYLNEPIRAMTFILPINLENPKGDIEKRLFHGDTRFLAFDENAKTIPGLTVNFDDYHCRFGVRYLDLQLDPEPSDEELGLRKQFIQYIKTYNKLLNEKLSVQ